MPQFDVAIQGLDKLRAAVEQAPDTIERWLQQAVDKSAAEIASRATRGILPWRTGRLTQSFTLLERGRLYASVGPTVEYAVYVHEGTAPHIIRAKNAKALFWEGAAHPVKEVQHPGTKPNPFMPRLIEASQDAINAIFADAVSGALAEIAG